MRQLTLTEIDGYRQARGRSALLYLTDRCPVGCDHCSVDARPLGPRITDRAQFARVLDLLCGTAALTVVGISGGEPFIERQGLVLAARRLTAAGKLIVPYTSGSWGRNPPAWIDEILRLSSCIVLSTDAFHAARLPTASVINAARTIAAAGVWIGCQVLAGEHQQAAATALLVEAFGPDWTSYAELRPIPLLPHGRAAGRAAAPPTARGRCTVAGTPVVRYDGHISACCNEVVATGGGPAGLRHHADTPGVLEHLAADPYLTALGTAGATALTRLPEYRDLAQTPVSDLCALCWRMVERGTTGPALQALVHLMAPGPRA
ncbi:hypothetical protein [Streptacidiphilus sp. PAMC 29251]